MKLSKFKLTIVVSVLVIITFIIIYYFVIKKSENKLLEPFTGPNWDMKDFDIRIPAFQNPGNSSYEDMKKYCDDQDKRLCDSAEICDMGSPRTLIQTNLTSNGDNWIAVGDKPNEWLTLNDVDGRYCKTHTEVAGGTPGWTNNYLTNFERLAKCCYAPSTTTATTLAPALPSASPLASTFSPASSTTSTLVTTSPSAATLVSTSPSAATLVSASTSASTLVSASPSATTLVSASPSATTTASTLAPALPSASPLASTFSPASSTTLSNNIPVISPSQTLALLNAGVNMDVLTSQGMSMNSAYKGPSTNIIQTNFNGTSNIYSPYLYYNKGLGEHFNGLTTDTNKHYYSYNK